MTRERVLTYVQEVAYLIKQVRDIDSSIAQMNSALEIAQRLQHTERIEKIVAQRAEAKKQRAVIAEVLCQKASRPDVEGAERLAQQIDTRLAEHDELQQQVAVLEARFELAATMQDFGDNPTENRATAEKMVSDARARAAKQIELAWDFIPNKPVVLSL